VRELLLTYGVSTYSTEKWVDDDDDAHDFAQSNKKILHGVDL
jgi:hypothetical protein